MANISSASGTVTFSEDFAIRHEAEIRKFIESYKCAYYGVQEIHDYDPETHTAEFWANGRWSFECSLEDFGGIPLHESEYKSNREFIELLAREGGALTYAFTDYECGNEVFYEATCGVSYSLSPAGILVPGYQEIESSSIPFTDKNRVDMGMEDGSSVEHFMSDDSFKEFRAQLMKETNLDENALFHAIRCSDVLDGYICAWRYEEEEPDECLIDYVTEGYKLYLTQNPDAAPER